MFRRMALRVCMAMCVLVYAGTALAQSNVQEYFSDAAGKVKATSDPSEKREILSDHLSAMSKTLDKVQSSPMVSQSDRVSLDRVKAILQENQDELAGANGYTRVPDDQLNAFSDYVVQNMEQADRTITLSLVTALLIVIIIILVA